jgi:Cof subfamily protein (haloacid dehalogenase superfamily)
MTTPSDIDLLISDMDGTLVTPDKTLTPRTVDAVARLAGAGIGFSLISARPARGMIGAIKTLKVSLPTAAFNGGVIVAPDGAVMAARRLPGDLSRAAIALLRRHGADIWVFADNEWLLTNPAGPKIDRERRSVSFEPTVVETFDAVIDRIDKIVGVSEDYALLAGAEAEAKGLWGDQATIGCSQPYYLDFTHHDANKGGGVTALAAQLGVPLARVAVIGDMFNDVAMFKVAGYSIAMGQAPKAVKDQATTVTGANTEEGFADAVDRLLAARAAKVPA